VESELGTLSNENSNVMLCRLCGVLFCQKKRDHIISFSRGIRKDQERSNEFLCFIFLDIDSSVKDGV